jgi:membrane associated rhomboid family serine protease
MQPMTPVVRNLIIINVLFYLAMLAFGGGANNLPWLTVQFGGYYPASPMFKPWQLITHMFMHDHKGFTHIFFNMFALYMFGSSLERVWGAKRFIIYYFVCGLGAFFLHQFVNGVMLFQAVGTFFPNISELPNIGAAYSYIYPVVGASGAVFGLLLAFGMLFPNTQLMLLFPPIPIKAKYFVIGYGAIELFMALGNSPGDNVAHFAHLGGMLFGFILLKKWQKERNNFY